MSLSYPRSTSRLLAAVASIALLACDDDTTPSGAISIAVSPSVVTIAQGASGSVTVSLSRTPGFSNPVTLSLSGLPAGVTTTITPQVLEGLVASAVIEIEVGAAVAIGNHFGTVNASAEGGQTTLVFTLSVVAGSQ
jgi:serine protease